MWGTFGPNAPVKLCVCAAVFNDDMNAADEPPPFNDANCAAVEPNCPEPSGGFLCIKCETNAFR
ncbi:hypothetical protein DERF_009534 [Dermatophagoides farinae]|uniref:Uncharacterized protein n=1 Tax=Dermatophagoides farinae TaxID=6954 RepID=A0A922HV61_DERFA|nr:hypothetical protein DERF_009534 [Dermatophagoides farinae]